MESKTYQVSNISCSACKENVEKQLLSSDKIHSALVDLDKNQVTIQMEEELSIAELQQALGRDSHYRIR